MGLKKNLRNWIRKHLRTCAICGSYENKGDIVCPQCFFNLEVTQDSKFQSTSINSLMVRYLYSWQRDQNRPVSLILASLKNSEFESDWRSFSEKLWFFHHRGEIWNEEGGTLFIPAPASNPAYENHALGLAKSLVSHENIGGPIRSSVVDCLVILSEVPQKKLSRALRSQRQMTICEKFTNYDFSKHKIIFVDDVVTTGSTARAAWEALGQPKHFEVWCIALRRLAGLMSI